MSWASLLHQVCRIVVLSGLASSVGPDRAAQGPLQLQRSAGRKLAVWAWNPHAMVYARRASAPKGAWRWGLCGARARLESIFGLLWGH
jgi:hypothetical protein